jgi:carbonic anhydrase
VTEGDHFADVLTANANHAQNFSRVDLDGRAARGLAVLTCIDSRIDPLAMLGLKPGDAKILRNAGARVTDDVLATLVIARYLLGVERLMLIAHTDCRMVAASEAELEGAGNSIRRFSRRDLVLVNEPSELVSAANMVEGDVGL